MSAKNYEMVETTRTEAEQVRVELDEAEQKSTEHGSDGDLELTEQEADNIRKLQEQLHALEAKAQEATERAKQAEREQLRIIREQEKEVQLEKKAQEEKAEAEKRSPRGVGANGEEGGCQKLEACERGKKPSASLIRNTSTTASRFPRRPLSSHMVPRRYGSGSRELLAEQVQAQARTKRSWH